MVSRVETFAWVAGLGLVVALAIPWFLWGTSQLVGGLPVWLWWHIGWMLLTAAVFWAFARRAWGIGVTGGPDT